MIFTGIYNYFTLKATWRVKREPALPTTAGLGSPKSSRDVKKDSEVISKKSKGVALRDSVAARGASDDEYFSDSSGGARTNESNKV